MDHPEEYDLVVVGGGPGGSTLATLVAMTGHRVLLLERERFPRWQIGESLLPSTIHGICALLGVEDELANAGFVRKNGAAFRWGTGREPWIFGFSQAPLLDAVGANFAYQVERAKFDTILLENARRKGVEVREQHTVEKLLINHDRVIGVTVSDGNVRSDVRARFVADASGHSSRLYKHVGNRIFSDFFRNMALFGYFRGAGRLPAPNQGNILCEAFSDGWLWFIPLRHSPISLTSVGAVVSAENVAAIQNDPESAMRRFIGACPRISQLLQSATRVTEGMYAPLRVRRDWSYTNERFWAPGLLLIGDAACFIDPVLSTGVHLATYSALLAARSINTALRNGTDGEPWMEEFERRYRAEYATFYNFLLAFYDMHQDEGSYYWAARKVLGTYESANEAFVRLVAGGATAPEIYFAAKGGMGQALQDFANQLNPDVSLDTRGKLTRELAERLHAFRIESSEFVMHAGSEDLRSLTWGRKQPDPIPDSGQQGWIPTADGLHWTTSNSN